MFLTQLVTSNIYAGRISDQCLTQLVTAIKHSCNTIYVPPARKLVFTLQLRVA